MFVYDLTLKTQIFQAKVTANNDKNRTYSVYYIPKVTGMHKVSPLMTSQWCNESYENTSLTRHCKSALKSLKNVMMPLSYFSEMFHFMSKYVRCITLDYCIAALQQWFALDL